MKTASYLTILFLVLAAYLPANGEILIYNLTEVEGSSFLRMPLIDYPNGSDAISEGKQDSKGYLILDIDFSNMDISFTAENSTQISYSRSKNKRYNSQSHNFSGERFFTGNISYWVLTDITTPDEDEAVIMMYSGQTSVMNIGTGHSHNIQRIPKTLGGTSMASTVVHSALDDFLCKAMHTMSLRLNTRMTKEANQYWYDYEQAGGLGFDYTPFEWAVGGVDEGNNVYGIVKAKLELSGYMEYEADPYSDIINP